MFTFVLTRIVSVNGLGGYTLRMYQWRLSLHSDFPKPRFVFVYVLSFMSFDLAANTLVRSSTAGEISEASSVGVSYTFARCWL